MVALCCLLVTGVLSWSDCLTHVAAWDTLLWFAVLMSMCAALADAGVVAAFAQVGAQAAACSGWVWGLLHSGSR